MGELIFGAVAGALLLLGKYGSFWLFTGGPFPVHFKKYLICGPKAKRSIREMIKGNTIALFCVDLIGGWAASHIISTTSMVGMIAMISYSVACMFFLTAPYMWASFKLKIKSFWTPKVPKTQKKYITTRQMSNGAKDRDRRRSVACAY